eukprot:6661809-Prorocentrum_lima.AAC.1
MTSSLVGSEMCIRDRDWVVARCGWVEVTEGGRIGSWPGHHLFDLLRRRPVSYTHLTLPTICSV